MLEQDQSKRENNSNLIKAERSIREVDSLNLKKLLTLMSDTNLTEWNCVNCMNTISIVIDHSSGDTSWVEPLIKMYHEGRISAKNFAQIINEAYYDNKNNISVYLRTRHLYFGGFNYGARLYDVMYFPIYSRKETSEINANRQQFKLWELKDEQKIKEWQFKNYDSIFFFPIDVLLYYDDNEKLSKEMIADLKMQQIMHLSNEMQKHRIMLVKRKSK